MFGQQQLVDYGDGDGGGTEDIFTCTVLTLHDVQILHPSSNHIYYVNRENLRLFKMLKIKF